MIKRKTYTTSLAIAEELREIAGDLGVPESSIINFALKQFFWNYRKNEGEKNEQQQVEMEIAA